MSTRASASGACGLLESPGHARVSLYTSVHLLNPWGWGGTHSGSCTIRSRNRDSLARTPRFGTFASLGRQAAQLWPYQAARGLPAPT